MSKIKVENYDKFKDNPEKENIPEFQIGIYNDTYEKIKNNNTDWRPFLSKLATGGIILVKATNKQIQEKK